MLVLWAYGFWNVKRLEQAVSSLRERQQRQQDEMAALNAARDLGISPEQIEARIKELSAQLDARTRALTMLREGAVGQTDGFSRKLIALAGHPVEGLWLDHILLSGTSPSMALGGVAVSPDLIPRFLRGLSADDALTGVRFGELAIEGGQAFKFRAQGQPEAQPAKDPAS
jgi:hypothetical protein